MMTTDEMIQVLRAHKEGKKIQFRHKNESNWFDFNVFTVWDFVGRDYRVAPEPRKLREGWIHAFRLHDSLLELQDHLGDLKDPIFVREVASSGEPTVISSTVKTSTETVPRKPREWRIEIKRDGSVHPARDYKNPSNEYVHVREVLE